MADILDRIDSLITQCPCGADPRPGSAYCSDDCVPNWRGADTTSHFDGTAMRWRPDTGVKLPAFRTNPEVPASMRRSIDTEALHPVLAALQKIIAARLPSAPEPDHPLARMNARRTNAVYGPQHRPLPPRKLDPRR